MVLIQPEKSIRDQEITNFVAPEVEDERAPIRVLALAWIHVFVEIGPIEFGKPVRVLREMGRHPIHDHTDSGLMTFLDKMAEFIRGPKPAGRRVIVRDLIAPGTFERMFRNRH